MRLGDLPELLASLPRLGAEQAAAFEADLTAARAELGTDDLVKPHVLGEDLTAADARMASAAARDADAAEWSNARISGVADEAR